MKMYTSHRDRCYHAIGVKFVEFVELNETLIEVVDNMTWAVPLNDIEAVHVFEICSHNSTP